MDNLLNSVVNFLNLTTIVYVIIGCAGVILLAWIITYFRNLKMYDVLVEVVPKWGFKEQVVTIEETPKQTKFQKLLGIQPKPVKKEIPIQQFQSYFVPGAYLFNKKNGVYELVLKDKNKSVIPAIPYDYFVPINFGRFKRYLKLWRESPADFKPCKIRFEGYDEVRNIYDSESTYISFKTQEELEQRFRRASKLKDFLPWIGIVIIAIVFVISTYINAQAFEKFGKQLGAFTEQLGEWTKAMLAAQK